MISVTSLATFLILEKKGTKSCSSYFVMDIGSISGSQEIMLGKLVKYLASKLRYAKAQIVGVILI